MSLADERGDGDNDASNRLRAGTVSGRVAPGHRGGAHGVGDAWQGLTDVSDNY